LIDPCVLTVMNTPPDQLATRRLRPSTADILGDPCGPHVCGGMRAQQTDRDGHLREERLQR